MSYFALVPAAGTGSRMEESQPKQYLPLLGRPLIHHAIAPLCRFGAIQKVFVVLAPGDEEWGLHDWSAFGDKLEPIYCGGATRCLSVFSGLSSIADKVGDDDWILVHDAARPCLSELHLDRLLTEVGDDSVGGILGVPVADTLKRSGAGNRIDVTVPRERLWQAQTPQMFRFQLLKRALEERRDVTDESAAVESLGVHPRLVAADMTNLKVTFPADMMVAEWILRMRNRNG